MGHNEMLISEVIQNRPRDQIILSVKFGAQRDPAGKWVGFDGRPAALKTALAYGVLSRGLISDRWSKDKITPGDFRSYSPRFQGENLEKNIKLLEPIRMIAEAKGATLAQVAIAWVLSRGKEIVPIIGARRRQSLAESLAALDVIFSSEDLLAIERAMPEGIAAGSRYAEAQMAHLDSERG